MKDCKQRCRQILRNVLSEHGVEIPPDITISVVPNSGDTYHLVIPPDPNATLSEESLESFSGGGTLSTAVCVPSTISTVGSASTLTQG